MSVRLHGTELWYNVEGVDEERRRGMSNYMAIIHKEPNGWYSAEVPALPGCYTDGATLDEIHFNLKEAIQLYLQDQPEGVEPVEMMQVCV